MNKFVKIVGIVGAVIVALAIVLVVLAKVLITPERVKETVLPLAEQNLQRKIDLGDIRVSLLSGIELHDLKVYERNNKDLFMSTELVRLKYQLLPLLDMRVVIDEVRVEQPRIRVVRMADGRFNFSDIAGGANKAENARGGMKTEAQPAATDKTGPSINLLVSQVRLQDGELLFLDHVLNDKAPYRFDIKNLDVAADGITLTGSIPVQVSCNLNGGSLALDGTVNLQQLGGEFDVNLLGIDVLAFKPYFEDKFPGQLGSMKLDVKTSLSGTPDRVKAAGDLVLSDLDFLLEVLPDAPFENTRIAVGHNLDMNISEERLQLDRLAVDLNGIQAELKGSLSQLFAQPVANLELNVPGIELRQAMSSVPVSLVKDFKGLDPAGTIRMQAKLVGGVDDPLKLLQHATVELDNVQATAAGHRPSLDGRIALTADRLQSEDLKLRMGDNVANIALTAENLFGRPIAATADLNSEKFLLDPLLKGGGAAAVSQGTPSSAKTAGRETVTADTTELGPFDIPVQASGTVRIGETLYKGLSINDLFVQYHLKDNVLTISRMDGNIAGGTFSNKARVDLGKKGLVYDTDIALETIQADPLLTAFVPKAAGSLLGVTNLRLAVNGRGTKWETLSKRLGGHGDMLVKDGRLVSPALVQGFASFLQLPDMNEIRFSNFKGAFKIVDGKVRLDSQMLSDRIKLMPKGTIGLDGSLDLSLDTRLSPEVAGRLDQKGKVTQYLQDKEGWSQLPLLVSGAISKPRFGIDPKAVKAQATKALSDELEGQIDKLFEKKQSKDSQEAEGQPVEEEPAQKMLKDSLKRLFGN